MADLVFFYGTLMAGFDRRRRAGIDDKLTYVGRGAIQAALFDIGLYPAAVPALEGLVWGEVYAMRERATVLSRARRDRRVIEPTIPIAASTSARKPKCGFLTAPSRGHSVYFYNAPLGRAPRITSGDYLEEQCGKQIAASKRYRESDVEFINSCAEP